MKVKDLVGIGATVKTVSDAVRGAVSTLYRPIAIKKQGRARAEVAAYKVEALAQAEVKAALIKQDGAAILADRVRQRFIFERTMQQGPWMEFLGRQLSIPKSKKGRKAEKFEGALPRRRRTILAFVARESQEIEIPGIDGKIYCRRCPT